MSFFSRLPIACAILLCASLPGVDLINGLGNPPNAIVSTGFGENVLAGNDDLFTAAIDITPVFPNGLLFGGELRTTLFVNNNGSITFIRGAGGYTPAQIQALAPIPRIAAYFADVDTSNRTTFQHPPGTSRGTNLVYWDLDAEEGVFTATWDDVGYFSGHNNLANAFQIRLIRVDDAGSFDIEFRYELVEWTTGDASGGIGGFGGTVSRAGYTAANGTDFYELPQSGIQAEMLALETLSNLSPAVPGLWRFSIRRPVATITPAEGAYTNASPIRFTIDWSGTIRDFTEADLSATGGTIVLGSLTAVVAGTSYTVDVTPAATDGPVTLTIAADAVLAQGNGNGNVVTSRTVNSDRTPPVLTITPSGTTIFTERVYFNAAPSEPLLGFVRGDVVSTNGSLISFQNGYAFSIQTASDGPLTVTVPRTLMTDRAGNMMVADATATVTVKTVGPQTTVSVAPVGPVNGDTLTFTIAFALPVTGLTVGDLAITNGNITSLTGAGTTYTVVVTPTADGLVRLTVPTGAAVDADGLGNLTGSVSVVNDLIAPTVSISMPTGPIAGPVLAYLDFSEPVTGVLVATGGGGTVGPATPQTGSLTRFAVTLTPSGAGPLILNVTGADDFAGNALVGSVSASVTTDTALAALAITSATDRTNASPIPVTFTFTGGAVTGFTADDVSVTNGTRGALLGTGPFTMDVIPASDGPVTISVASAACQVGGPTNNAAGRLVVISDRSGPVPSVRIDPVNGVPGQTAVVTLTFPEPVTGLAIGDLTVAGGAVTSVTANATNTVFTVTINCSARPSASTVVTLTAGSCQDAAGNLNPGTTFTVYSIESTAGDSGLDRSGSCATGSGLAIILIGLLGIGLRQRRRRA